MGEEGSPRLPKADSFFVVDSLDGTEEFIAGGDGWAVSVAHMRGGVTHAGIVVHPMKRIALMGIRGEGVFSFEYPKLTDGKIIGKARWKAFRREDASYCKFGCDLSPVSSSRYWQEAQALTKAMKVRPNNQHAVAGGMYVALGLSAFWWSHTAHIWDLAALDVILAELGGTIAALDGSALIWDRPRMPPLVVAANRKCARIVRQAISSIP